MSRTAVVVGAGPNGLAAAVALALQGWAVQLLEAADHVGGGASTAELTLPGFRHDVCSAVHPMAVTSPFLSRLPLARHGLAWIHPPVLLAHPFDDGTAALLLRDVAETATTLGSDAAAYRRLMAPFSQRVPELFEDALGPPLRLPSRPLLMARLGLRALRSASGLARSRFRGERARAFFLGIAAHTFLPLDRSPPPHSG